MRSCDDDPLYDISAVRDLFDVVGQPSDHEEKLEVVWDRLRSITFSFAFDLWWELQPSPAAEKQRVQKFAGLCRDLLAVVGTGEREPSHEAIHPIFTHWGLYAAARERGETDPKTSTVAAFQAVHLLRQDADRLLEIVEKRLVIKPVSEGRPEARAMKLLVANLDDLYWTTWAKKPGVALQPKPGPFVRLMEHVAKSLQDRLGPYSFSFTATSLARVWQELPAHLKSGQPTVH